IKHIMLYIGVLLIQLSYAQESIKDSKNYPSFPKSEIPQTKFSNTLQEQLKQLESDVQMEFFRQNRVKLSRDPYRPIYHFSSPDRILHDPNGLCFWQGKWDMFYQFIPSADRRQHWGHAV